MKIKKLQFPPAKVSEKLMSETQNCAEIEQENLSEYIRKSVEMRNKEVLSGTFPGIVISNEMKKEFEDIAKNGIISTQSALGKTLEKMKNASHPIFSEE